MLPLVIVYTYLATVGISDLLLLVTECICLTLYLFCNIICCNCSWLSNRTVLFVCDWHLLL